MGRFSWWIIKMKCKIWRFELVCSRGHATVSSKYSTLCQSRFSHSEKYSMCYRFERSDTFSQHSTRLSLNLD